VADHPAQQHVRDQLAPLASDAAATVVVDAFARAFGGMLREAWDLGLDDEGPWTRALDLDRCEDQWLPWLAQFDGTRLLPNTTPDQQRERVLSTDGEDRGTAAALAAAARPYLTGTKSVTVTERVGGNPFLVDVKTLPAETPNVPALQRALAEQTPAFIRLTFQQNVSQQIDQVSPTLQYDQVPADRAYDTDTDQTL
jgi:hypothetical protein